MKFYPNHSIYVKIIGRKSLTTFVKRFYYWTDWNGTHVVSSDFWKEIPCQIS